MKMVTGGKTWERTNVTNLLRNGQSETYYARVKVNGKQKWRTLKTKLFSVAKLKLGDVERDERAQGMVAAAEALPGAASRLLYASLVSAPLERKYLRWRGRPRQIQVVMTA